MLQDKLYRKVIDEIAPTTPYLTFYFQGEPYLNPDFLDMVRYAAFKKIYTATSTNAHYLDDEQARKTVESGLSRLIISIDGLDQESYEKYRIGGDLQKVLDGTKNIVRWKKELKSSTPHVIWQFLAVRHNEHQIDELRQLAKTYGVNKVAIKTAQIYDYAHGSALIPENEALSRYAAQADGTYRIKNQLLDHCWKMWSSCVITWDGEVIPCCFDKDAQHQLGSLQSESFQSVWQSAGYHAFRSSVLRSRSEIEMCKNCTEGSKVWA
jgi:radical SAM protein with 4Fe4S-binding SPASM domain